MTTPVDRGLHEHRLVEERRHLDVGRQDRARARQASRRLLDDVERRHAARSSAPRAARRARRPGARCWSAARSRRAPGRRRGDRSSCRACVRTGRSFRPAIASGDAFMRTLYSVSPNLTVPEGRIRFCVLTAATTSAGARPRACMRRQIEVDRDHADLAAVRERDRDARDRDELRAQLVHRGVEHRLLGQRRARQRELDDRDARRRVLDDERRRDARRQLPHLRLHDRDDLRERGLDVRGRLEEDLDDRDAGERARLDVLDVAHRRGQPALALAGDALPHLLRVAGRCSSR